MWTVKRTSSSAIRLHISLLHLSKMLNLDTTIHNCQSTLSYEHAKFFIHGQPTHFEPTSRTVFERRQNMRRSIESSFVAMVKVCMSRYSVIILLWCVYISVALLYCIASKNRHYILVLLVTIPQTSTCFHCCVSLIALVPYSLDLKPIKSIQDQVKDLRKLIMTVFMFY